MGRSGRVWVAAQASGLCLFLAAPLAAQQPAGNGGDGPEPSEAPSEEARAVARESYAEGQQEYAAGNYEKAERAFQRAYGAVPEPVVLLGLAKAREKRGNVRGAIEALETYLAERADAPDREEVEKRIAELRGRPGMLAVDSRPSGGRISVDGESTEHRTPIDLSLEPGEHTIAVSQEGFQTVTRTVEVQAGEQSDVMLKLPVERAGNDEEVFGAGGAVGDAPEDGAKSDGGSDAGPSTGVWVSAGVAAAGLVTGTVLGFMALSKESEFDSAEAPTHGMADSGERLALFADVAFGVAAAAAITGLVLYFTGNEPDDDERASRSKGDEPKAEVNVAPAIGRTSAGLDARVQF